MTGFRHTSISSLTKLLQQGIEYGLAVAKDGHNETYEEIYRKAHETGYQLGKRVLILQLERNGLITKEQRDEVYASLKKEKRT